MNDVKANGTSDRTLREIIRKELGSETNRRFLRGMRAFAADPGLPDGFDALLSKLDAAERTQRSRN